MLSNTNNVSHPYMDVEHFTTTITTKDNTEKLILSIPSSGIVLAVVDGEDKIRGYCGMTGFHSDIRSASIVTPRYNWHWNRKLPRGCKLIGLSKFNNVLPMVSM